jgi:kynureninase
VTADYRPPGVIRIAPAPLYNSFEEIWSVVQHLKELIERREYEQLEDQPSIVP